ncbi:MAG: hypothetical protein KF744_02635 [Taibaiella sp.]|nr:hypothetical protein [Taibaiella sp.]
MKNIARHLVVVVLLFLAIITNISPVLGAATTKKHTISASVTPAAVEAGAALPPGEGVGDEDWTPEQKGKMDADRFYDGWRPARTLTIVVTALFGAILGLIPAIATSVTPPKPQNLGCGTVSLMRDARYKAAYEREAKKIKSRKVWGGFGIGVLLAIALFTIFSAA